MERILGVDTGGSFTDLIIYRNGNIQICKTPSFVDQPERSIINGLNELDVDTQKINSMMHGTTLATNAVLEGRGATTAYITNYGFADTLTIGRQNRKELYNLKPSSQVIPIEKELCMEVGGRVTPSGEILNQPTSAEITSLKNNLTQLGVESVAINLLFSFINKGFESDIARALESHFFVSQSSLLHPVPGEYERGIITWLNARIGPLINAYLKKLNSLLPTTNIHMMQSNGHTIEATQASKHSINLLLSGPAAGVMAVQHLAHELNQKNILSFDMGGTSTDISIIDQEITLTQSGRVGGFPISIPMLDIQTIGAGGGSIATLDEAGLLRIGPESAGSTPGPACYNRGGHQPTVTDANLILNRIPDQLQQITLDKQKSLAALQPLCDQLNTNPSTLAQGIVNLADEQMIQALRKVMTSKNYVARDFTLCGFGAAGGLHICALCEGLKIKCAIVPSNAGIFSAVGLLTAKQGIYRTHSVYKQLDQLGSSEIDAIQEKLKQQASQAMHCQQVKDFETRYFAELRYHGQLFCFRLKWQGIQRSEEAFHMIHSQQYGHKMDSPVELVTLQIEARSNAKLAYKEIMNLASSATYDSKLPPQKTLLGPAVIADSSCTIWVAEHWSARRDTMGNIFLNKVE